MLGGVEEPAVGVLEAGERRIGAEPVFSVSVECCRFNCWGGSVRISFVLLLDRGGEAGGGRVGGER